MSKDDEVGVRLSVKDRARFSSEANRAEKDIEKIGKAARDADKKARSSSGGFGVFGKAIGAIGSAVKFGLGAVAAGTAVAVASGIKFIKLATDAFETQQKYHEVFKEFTPDVDKFVKATNQKFGIPTKELEDATAIFGVFGKTANISAKELPAFTTSLVQAGLDLSSFHNIDPSDVFAKIQSGLAGQVRPLREVGIFLSENAVNAKAVEMGMGGAAASVSKVRIANQGLAIAQAKAREASKKYGSASIQAASATLAVEKAEAAAGKATEGHKVKLTDQQKVLVRQRLILDQLGDANGDLQRTLGSQANQWRALKGRIQEAETTIGFALLPAANKVTTALNAKMKPATEWLQKNAPIWADKLTHGLSNVVIVAQNAWRAFNAKGFSGMATYIDETVHAHGRLKDILDKVHGIASDLWTIVTKAVLPAFKDMKELAIDPLVNPLSHLDDVTHFLAGHTDALRIAIETIVGVMVIERGLTIGLAIAEGVMTTARILAALATGGYTAALIAATVAAESEAVAGGVAIAVLDSSIVSLGAAAIAWAWHTAMVVFDTVGREAWLALNTVPVLVQEGIQLGSLLIAWAGHTAAQAADVAVSLAWKAVGLGALLVDLGIQLAIDTGRWIAHSAAVAVSTVASGSARMATLAWTAAQWALNLAMEANPIGLAIVAIALFAAGIVILWKKSEAFRDIVTGAFHAVGAAVSWTVNFIKDHWLLLLGILLGPVGIVVTLIIANFDRIKGAVGATVGWVRDRWNDFVGFFTGLGGTISGIASGMWDGIKNAFRAALNFIIRSWNRLEFKIPGIDAGPIHFAGFTLGVPDIPELHTGGTTTTGGIVNLRPDEELVVLPPAASVIPLTDDKVPAIARSGGEPKIVQLVVDRKVLAQVMIDGAGDIVARR